MYAAVVLAFGLLLATSSAKTVMDRGDGRGSANRPETSTEAADAGGLMALVRGIVNGVGEGTAKNVTSPLLPTLLQQLLDAKNLVIRLSDGLGVHEDLTKPLFKIIEGMSKLGALSPKALGAGMNSLTGNDIVSTEHESEDELSALLREGTSVNGQYLNLVERVFREGFGDLPPLPVVPISSESKGGPNVTASGVWMLIKSTWQRILAYVEEENSLQLFMQLTPVKIINRLLDLGDDLNLINFLAKKLDRDLAQFIAEGINPYLGPLKDFDTFYGFAREHGLGGFLDYFGSRNFGYTMTSMSRFISAYFEDSFSDDVAEQYISFISFNNTDLYNFYRSLLGSRRSSSGEDSGHGRFKREDLDEMIGGYKFTGYDFQPDGPEAGSSRELSRDGGYGGHSGGGYGSGSGGYGGGYGHGGGGGGGHGGGGGGYGGGGYGSGYGGGYGHGGGSYGGAVVDPAVVLSSVAIGALLGFLLFRLIRGTRSGRRDIGDGSLSLWLSDLPDGVLPWGSSAERTRRHAQDFNTTGGDEFNLPDSMRGDVWSTDPLVGDDLLDDEFEEDDIADHLNQLWRVYKRSHWTTCVQSHLCGVVANSSAEHLTGKDSSLALIMASVSNLVGAAESGQLVDDVVQAMVVGSPFACPTHSQCHLL